MFKLSQYLDTTQKVQKFRLWSLLMLVVLFISLCILYLIKSSIVSDLAIQNRCHEIDSSEWEATVAGYERGPTTTPAEPSRMTQFHISFPFTVDENDLLLFSAYGENRKIEHHIYDGPPPSDGIIETTLAVEETTLSETYWLSVDLIRPHMQLTCSWGLEEVFTLPAPPHSFKWTLELLSRPIETPDGGTRATKIQPLPSTKSAEFIAFPSKSPDFSNLSRVDKDSIVAKHIEVPSAGIMNGYCHESSGSTFGPTDSLSCYEYYLFKQETGSLEAFSIVGTPSFTSGAVDDFFKGYELSDVQGINNCGERDDCDTLYVAAFLNQNALLEWIDTLQTGCEAEISGYWLWHLNSKDLLVSGAQCR